MLSPDTFHTEFMLLMVLDLDKFGAIRTEIQDASRSINKSFGIFNEETLRHCSSNVAHDVEGYKSLIARPYVNRLFRCVNRLFGGDRTAARGRERKETWAVIVCDLCDRVSVCVRACCQVQGDVTCCEAVTPYTRSAHMSPVCVKCKTYPVCIAPTFYHIVYIYITYPCASRPRSTT
jgi:hypothetical protein